jgi:molybdenum cofactor guanylyltransferase
MSNNQNTNKQADRRITSDHITAVILAGGLGSRMGGADKGLQQFRHAPLALHALLRIQPQVGEVLLNANRNIGVYEGFGIPVICDQIPDYAGPLAGMHAALSTSSLPFVVTVPCDVPLFPENLVERLSQPFEKNPDLMLTVVQTSSGDQPVFCLIRIEALTSLEEFMKQGKRKIDAWYAQIPHAKVYFEDEKAFHNVNTVEELKSLESSK